MFRSLKNIFKAYFVTGLLVLGPLVVCYFIVKTVIEWADSILQTKAWLPFSVPGFGFVLAIVIILTSGFLGRNIFGKYLFSGAGDVIARIPFIGAIYSSTKQIFETLLSDRNKHFGRVVVINFPHSAAWTLAFVTSETVPQQVQNVIGEKLLSVYIPTTPNPTSGFYVYVPHSLAKATDLTVEEAFKIIVSLGLVAGHE